MFVDLVVLLIIKIFYNEKKILVAEMKSLEQ